MFHSSQSGRGEKIESEKLVCLHITTVILKSIDRAANMGREGCKISVATTPERLVNVCTYVC